MMTRNKAQSYAWSAHAFLAMLLTTITFAQRPAAADTYTVDVDGNGADFESIQPALDAASNGDTVLVSPGTYFHGAIPLNFQGKAIELRSTNGAASTTIVPLAEGNGFTFESGETATTSITGFTIRFAQTGMSINDASPTISQCSFTDNRQGVRVQGETAQPEFLNSTFIDNGVDTGGGTISYGGAVAAENLAHPRLANCAFNENTAVLGGGAILVGSEASIELDTCSFTMNTAPQGGAINLGAADQIQMDNCTFNANESPEDGSFTSGGGAIYAEYTRTLTLDGCTFTDNRTSFEGGAIRFTGPEDASNAYAGTLTLRGCTFEQHEGILFGGSNNLAGGAIFCNQSLQASENCVFQDNDALGAALYLSGSEGHARVLADCLFEDNIGSAIRTYDVGLDASNCVFQFNSSAFHGGAINAQGGSSTFTDTLFSSNTAAHNGGAVYLNGGAQIDFTSCTFYNNAVNGGDPTPAGGGLYNDGPVTLAFNHCSFCANWNTYTGSVDHLSGSEGNDIDGNGVYDIHDLTDGDDSIDVDYDGDGTCDAIDPDDDDDGIPDASDDCPFDALNDADNDGVCGDVDECEGHDDNLDSDGDGHPDGCDPCPSSHAITVALDGSACFDTIQAAVDAAADGDEIVVAPGVYFGEGEEVVNMLGKAITLRSSGGAEVTFIDGRNEGSGSTFGHRRGVLCATGETSATVIDGFTMTDCSSPGENTLEEQLGGGMLNWGSSPTITNCVFDSGWAFYGGGMGNYQSSPTVTNTIFRDCYAEANEGGGVNNRESAASFENCTFISNETNTGFWFLFGSGGGMRCSSSTTTLNNCTFLLNESAEQGGAWSLHGFSHGSASNCSFTDNWVYFDFNGFSGGGAIYVSGNSSLSLTDCNLSENTSYDWSGYQYDSPRIAPQSGGAIYNAYGGTIHLTRCTLDSNGGWAGNAIYARGESDTTLIDCTITNNSGGVVDDCPPGWASDCNGTCFPQYIIDENTWPGCDNDYGWIPHDHGCAECPPGVALWVDCEPVTDCPTEAFGGAIYLKDDANCTISGTTICGNTSGQIIGEYTDAGGNCIVRNCGTDGCGTPPCPADIDGSGSVDGADLSVLLGAWGMCPE